MVYLLRQSIEFCQILLLFERDYESLLFFGKVSFPKRFILSISFKHLKSNKRIHIQGTHNLFLDNNKYNKTLYLDISTRDIVY